MCRSVVSVSAMKTPFAKEMLLSGISSGKGKHQSKSSIASKSSKLLAKPNKPSKAKASSRKAKVPNNEPNMPNNMSVIQNTTDKPNNDAPLESKTSFDREIIVVPTFCSAPSFSTTSSPFSNKVSPIQLTNRPVESSLAPIDLTKEGEYTVLTAHPTYAVVRSERDSVLLAQRRVLQKEEVPFAYADLDSSVVERAEPKRRFATEVHPLHDGILDVLFPEGVVGAMMETEVADLVDEDDDDDDGDRNDVDDNFEELFFGIH